MRTRHTAIICMIPMAASILAGCAPPRAEASKPRAEGSPSKAEGSPSKVEASQPKAEASPSRADFRSFKLVSGAGPCPPEMDCSGFIELLADGTLKVDNIGEMPRGTVHEVKVAPADLKAALEVLMAPSLKAVLDGNGQECPVMHDVWESMTLTLEGGVHTRRTTGCPDAVLTEARKAVMGLAKKHFPAHFS